MVHENTPAPPIWLLPAPPTRTRTLGRTEIVTAAMAIADEGGGAQALNMRAVATRLGSSTPMSLYRYVHSKDGLVDLMLDAAQSELDVPGSPSGDWRADLRGVALSMWRMTRRHPWFAGLVHSRPPAGPNAVRKLEFVLSVFEELGKDLATAMNFGRLLDSHVYGLAMQAAEERKMWQANDFQAEQDPRELMRSWFGDGAADPEHRRVAALTAAMLAGKDTGLPPGSDAQFELGIDCLLDGIAARL
jgi:AcrR family transcriptional regulator